MAIQKQPITINLAGGLNTKTDKKHLIPGQLTVMENGVYRKGMRIDKRRGYDLTSNNDVLGNALGIGSSLGVFNDELLQFNNQNLYGYSEGTDSWVNKGASLNTVIASSQVIKNTASQTQCDCAIVNNVGLYAWEDSRGGVRASVVDETSGSILLADQLISASAERVKCLAFGPYLYVFYFLSTDIRASRINSLNPSAFDLNGISVSGAINTTTRVYDVINYNDQRIVIAINGNASEVTFNFVDEDLSQIGAPYDQKNSETVGSSPFQCMSMIQGEYDGDPCLYITLFNTGSSGTIRFGIYDVAGNGIDGGLTNVLTSVGTVNNITSVFIDSSTGVRIYYEIDDTNPDENYIRQVDIVDVFNVGTPSDFAKSVGLWSKVFSYTDENAITDNFVAVAHESTLQSTYFLLRDDGIIVGKQQYTNGGGLPTRPLLATINQSAGKFTYAILKKNRIVSENATIFTPTGVMRTSVDFTNANRFVSKQLGNNQLIVGGVLNMYDGQSIVEHGFHLYPERVVASAVGSGGSLANGSYQVYVVYEWTDNFGQIHRSRPSVAQTVTCSAGGTDSITVTAPTLRLTRKDGTNRSNVSVVGYVTEANGTIPYRFTSVSTPILNDVTADTVSLGTITSVSTSNEILYTTGDVLANDPAPACSVIEVFQNRAWLAGLEEKSSVVFSKENKAGFPVEFSDEFIKAIQSSGGKVTALSFVDDKLIALKPDTFYITYGDGPNDTNTLGGFSEFEDVSVDVGCENPRSIARLPNGIIMKTKKGFYSIDSTLNPQYIGAPVEDFNDLTISSANLIPDLNEVRFTASDGAMLIYNYFFQKWSSAPNLASSSSVLWKNKLILLKTDGQIFAQNSSIFKDNNAAYGMVLESGWISLGNISSFKRIYQIVFFGEYKSKHQVRVKVAYDNNEAWEHVGVYDPTSEFPVEFYGDNSPYGETGTVYGGSRIDYAIVVKMKRQKCSSFKFRFEELIQSETTGTHESLTISDVGILVGLKKGIVKKGQNRNMKVN